MGDYTYMEAMYTAQQYRPLSRGTYLGLTLVQQMLAGGVIFGWQALLPVLYETGVFADLCEGGKADPSYPCLKMRSQLATVFSIAGSASAVGALVAGLLMDFCGTKVARMVSAGVVLIGALFLASASENEYMWFPGLACVGFGGNGLQITSFHISNLFVGNERLVVSMITGSFAASSFLFTLMRLLVERAHLNLQFQFMGYAVICGAVVMTSAVWPIKPFTSPDDLEPPEDASTRRRKYGDSSMHSHVTQGDWSGHSDWTNGVPEPQSPFTSLDGSPHTTEPLLWRMRTDSLHSGTGSDDPHQLDIVAEEGGGITSQENLLCIDHSKKTLKEQLMTPEWNVLLFFFLVQLVTSTFYLTAVGDQLQCWSCGCAGSCESTCLQVCAPADADRGREWLTIFGIIFPLGFITTPICGFLQDRYQLSVLLVFVNGCFVVWQLAAIIPNLYAQMLTLIIFSSARQFLFSFFFASVGSIFGYSNFGFLTGLANGISAVVLLVNAPLYTVVASRFGGAYTGMAGISLVFFFLAVYLWRRLAQHQKQQLLEGGYSFRESGEASRDASQHSIAR